MNDSAFGKFFLPGPTEVHPDVLAAQTRPMIPHRGVDMTSMLQRMETPLKGLFRTERPVMVGSCSATGFMEMAVRCGVRHRMLSLVSGAFGGRFAAIGAACGREVFRLEVALGQTIEPDMLRDALKHSPVDAVTMVHSETSTGALAPLPELAKVVQEFDDVLLLVDAVTSLGGVPVETDDWGLDFVLTGSQKALALPPGLAFGVASDQMLERAKDVPERGAYFDVLAFDDAARQYQPTNTPAMSTLFALDAQLARIENDGGVEARWRRHRDMLSRVEKWVEEVGTDLGVAYLPQPDRRSWTVSCLKSPDGVNGRTVAKRLGAQGWTIGSGYGPLRETTFRIGHMGDHTADELDPLLEELERVLRS